MASERSKRDTLRPNLYIYREREREGEFIMLLYLVFIVFNSLPSNLIEGSYQLSDYTFSTKWIKF